MKIICPMHNEKYYVSIDKIKNISLKRMQAKARCVFTMVIPKIEDSKLVILGKDNKPLDFSKDDKIIYQDEDLFHNIFMLMKEFPEYIREKDNLKVYNYDIKHNFHIETIDFYEEHYATHPNHKEKPSYQLTFYLREK